MDHKLNHIEFVKTILMLLVITGHAVAFWSGRWFTCNPVKESLVMSILFIWIGSFVTSAFALVSGYLFAYKIRKSGYSGYVPFLKNKAKRLLVPYLFVMVTWVAPITAYFFHLDTWALVKKYILCIDPCQLWFLWMLFCVFSIVWPLRKVMTDRPAIGWAIAIVFYGIGTVGQRLVPNVFCIWTACKYVSFFYIGMRIRIKEEDCGKSITEFLHWGGWIGIDLTVFFANMFVSGQSGVIWKLTGMGLSFLLNCIGAIMAWTVLQSLAGRINWKDSRFFRKMSSCSMPMYLYHQQIVYFTITWLNGKVNPWINAGVNFAAALIGSFLISSILMRWKTTRLLIGEK